jgi:hypothetical protein
VSCRFIIPVREACAPSGGTPSGFDLHAQAFSCSVRKGIRVSHLPVAAAMALATAGASGGTPGSPMPVGFSADFDDVHLDLRHLVDAQIGRSR